MSPSSSCLFVFLLFATLLHAQNPDGALRGVVQDSTRARVTSALIAARLQCSSPARTAACDDRGEFRIGGLVPGTCTVDDCPVTILNCAEVFNARQV